MTFSESTRRMHEPTWQMQMVRSGDNSKTQSLRQIYRFFFQCVFGHRLYNSLTEYLRDIESIKTEKFKFELDKFLEIINDQPKMPNYVTAVGSNSILYSSLIWGLREFTKVVGPWCSLCCFEITPSIQEKKYHFSTFI